ncbi:MAG: hypothetical protein E7338_06070 [Clostridiales bacterium]|nr:hypothetical protein [Clostridiales bacterium]
MTNKKLWLSLLVVVLVVCMLSVTLFACNKDDESKKTPPTPSQTVEAQAIDAIINGIKTSVADGDMTDLKVDGTLGLTLGDKEYALKLALELDLLQFNGYNYEKATGAFDPNGEYFTKSGSTYSKVEKPDESKMDNYYVRVSRKDVEHADTSNTKVTAELKDVKADSTLFGIYYFDGAPNADQNPSNTNIYDGNYLFLQAKTKTEQKKVKFAAPNVAAVQNALNGQVDFHGIDLADEDVWGSVDTVTGIIAGLASDGVCTSTEASITLKIGDLLDPNNENNLLSLVSGLQDWLNALDLDIDATALGELLPNISLVLSATLDNGKATGFDISLKLAEKDMVIKNKSKDHTVIKVNMDKDVTVGLSLDYTIGTCTIFYPSDFQSWPLQENLLDVAVSVDLKLDTPLGVSFKLNKTDFTLAVPAGSYTLSLEVAANPWEIIKNLDKISFDNTAKIIDSIKTILTAVASVNIDLHNNTADTTALRLLVANEYDGGVLRVDSDGKPVKTATIVVDSSILTGLGSQTIDIDAAINLVLGFIPKSNKATVALDDPTYAPSTADAEDDEKTKLLKTIVGYLLGAYIGINDGNAITATFDSALTKELMIPFGGYKEWTGAYRAGFQYYTKNEGTDAWKKVTTETFDATKKYFTLEPAKFVEVDKTKTTFDSMRQYYTYSTADSKYVEFTGSAFGSDTYYEFEDAKYIKAEITSFAPATDYYYWVDAAYTPYTYSADTWDDAAHYVKGKSDGGDFGMGLNASLVIGKDGSIKINATVTNLDFMGLPQTITAEISNLKVELFNNNFFVYKDGSTTIVRYSEINA